MTRDTLIVGAAPAPGHDGFYRGLLAEYEVVIAADAAGEWCIRLGRVPDVTVGDFDSAVPGAQSRLEAAGSRVVVAPVHKDSSDLDLCVLEARSLGAAQVVFAAAFTERPDHTLAALGSVLACSDLEAVVREPRWEAWTVGGEGPSTRSIQLAPGRTFSVIAPGGASGVSIEGGLYHLSDGDLAPLSSLGLSNTASRNDVVVSVRTGCVLVLAVSV